MIYALLGLVLLGWAGLGFMWALGRYYSWRLGLTKIQGNVVVRVDTRPLSLRDDITGRDVRLSRASVMATKPLDVRLN